MSLNTIILAAGAGTRMRSSKPKVLHPLAGKPLMAHVTAVAAQLKGDKTIVVYGHGGEQVRQYFAQDLQLHWVLQSEQNGTAHAVSQVLPDLQDDGIVLILYGDVPLIALHTLQRLVKAAEQQQLALLTAHVREPAGYGRIVRNDLGKVLRVAEHKDATESEKNIKEINTGFMALPTALLRDWLSRIDNNNAQGEYYLTDVVALAVQDNITVYPVAPKRVEEIFGINDRKQLAQVERIYQLRQAEQFMAQGLTLADPARFDLRGGLHIGQDVFIDVNVVLQGEVYLGHCVSIGPNCIIRDSVLGDGTQVFANTVIEDAHIGSGGRIGPFARIRPGTHTDTDVRIGNFVEVKKSRIGAGSKINHLSYTGDAQIGKAVNIGAGTITCNYDGANKHQTIIEDEAFIGSNSQLIAPVKVGKGATIGAGSTITRDTPDGQLTLTRAPQKTVKGWLRPRKIQSN